MKSLCAAALLSSLASAQVPGKLSYQGRLLRPDGIPETGVVSIGFALYSTASDKNAIWSETQEIALTDGYYSTVLGDTTAFPPNAFDSGERFLEISIRGDRLLPRQRVGSVPYALVCDTLDGEHAAGLRDFNKLTNVPAGLASPAAGAAAAIITKVTVSAKADVCATPAPAPHFELYINGLLIPGSGTDVLNAVAYKDYPIAIDPPRYASEVTVAFNTDWGSSSCDVNLYVDRIVLGTAGGTTTIPATDSAHVIYDRGVFFDNIDVVPATSNLVWNGALRFFVSPHNTGAEALVSCSRVYFAGSRTYSTLSGQLDSDYSGASVCGAKWHVCNYQEVTVYGVLGGCEAPASGAWIVGGFSNVDYHRQAIWNGQDSTQCAAGNFPSWHPPSLPYKGRVHCRPASNSLPIACCANY